MSAPLRGRYNNTSRGGGSGGGRGSDRGPERGGDRGGRGRGYYARGGGRGSGHDGARGGGGSFSRGRGDGRGGNTRGGGYGGQEREIPKKESILDLSQYLDREIFVKFNGGREGFDPLLNMVLDEAREKMRNEEGEVKSRTLGLAVIRGTHITTLHPVEGSESISNPYVAAGEASEDEGTNTSPAYQYVPKAGEDDE